MTELFKRCLNAKYVSSPEGGNYAIELDEDTLYLLFECSNGVEDWKNNFDFPVRPYQSSSKWLCHRGFLRVWEAMRKDIEAYVAEKLRFHPEIARIVCVGYSHGGALAVLATEDMEYLYGAQCTVFGYGFGAPRVLFGRVPREVKHRLRRFMTVRNIPDLVTHLPPALFGFQNAGVMQRIGQRGKYTPVSAHFAESYLTELEAFEKQGEVGYEEAYSGIAGSTSSV